MIFYILTAKMWILRWKIVSKREGPHHRCMRCIVSINRIAGIKDTVFYVKNIEHDPCKKYSKDHKQNQFLPELFLIVDQSLFIF